MVTQAARQASSPGDLYALLARDLPDAANRSLFLRLVGGGRVEPSLGDRRRPGQTMAPQTMAPRTAGTRDDGASNDTAPTDIAPDDTASNNTAPNDTTSDDTTPNHTISNFWCRIDPTRGHRRRPGSARPICWSHRPSPGKGRRRPGDIPPGLHRAAVCSGHQTRRACRASAQIAGGG